MSKSLDKFKSSIGMFTCLCLFINLSCASQNWKDVLDKIPSDELFKNSRIGWELEQSRPRRNAEDYFLKKIDGDTIKTLIITNRNKGGQAGAISYLAYYPSSKMNSDTCVVEMQPPLDTLYLYRIHNGNKEFLMGEYYFRKINLEFTSQELGYYMLHEDSLKEINGNNLPPLPPLSEAEQSVLDSLIQGWEKPGAKDQK